MNKGEDELGAILVAGGTEATDGAVGWREAGDGWCQTLRAWSQGATLELLFKKVGTMS